MRGRVAASGCLGRPASETAFLAGIARSVADRNVTINNVFPGYFDTERLREGFEASARRIGGGYCGAVGGIRAGQAFGTPREFGHACAFLCSAHAGYVTGQSLLLDGGLHQSAF